MGNVISLDPLIHRICDGVQNFAWELAVKHAAYVYHLQDNLQSLEKILDDMHVLSKMLQRRIEEKAAYGMQMSDKVALWTRRVEKQTTLGDELKIEGVRQVDSLCLAGICSTHYFSTSLFGGKVEKCVQELNTLKTEGDGFTEEDLVVAVSDIGSKKFCDSVGLEAKLDEVLTFLNQENVGIVGIYGQGGVGKTNLLKEINNHYVTRSSEIFLVVWIDVPKDVNLEAIQQAIGAKIGVPDELKVEVKASYILKALQQKKIILLLDDISKDINLSKIGIPPSNCLNHSKVVFTTRPEHVCRKMRPQPGRITSVKTLGDDQAWELFGKSVGEDIINSHPQISQLARRVARKCGGLPLALCLIGKAMSCEREPNVWEHILKTFERPALQRSNHQEANEDGMTELFSILRYSYDSLPNETYKACFLHCALSPKASVIPKTIIKKRWAFGGFGIDCNEDDLDPYYEAYRILNILVSSCLLEDEKDGVKMHDVVRSMALWIAKEDTLVMSGMELEEAPSVSMWKHMKRVSLTFNGIKELTQVPECPHLLTLHLNNNSQLNEICSGFFESMGMLTVLNLSCTSVRELPESISRLVSLKYLNLSRTEITELPVGLIKLKSLLFLDLAAMWLGLRRESQIFRHLSSLQYLGMMCAYYYYEEEEGCLRKVGGEGEILLEELQVLENLKVLEISLESFSGLTKLFSNRRLLKTAQTLSLRKFASPESMNISLLAQSKHLNSLFITKCDFKELKNSKESSSDAILGSSRSSVLTQMVSFNSIKKFGLVACNHMEDITCLVSMPNLRKLIVLRCDELKEIVSREKIGEEVVVGKGGGAHSIFSNLAVLKLGNLPVLKSIYPSNSLSMPFLYDLKVDRCPQLRELPLDPNRGVSGCSQINLEAEQEWWDAIEWEDDAAKAALLPRFNLNHLR